MASQSFSITTETMVRAVLIVLACYVAYLVRGVLLILFLAFIVATVLHPIVKWAHRYYIPRPVTVILTYIFGATLFVGIGWLLLPLFISEISSIAQNFTPLWNKAIVLLPPEKSALIRDTIQQNLSSIATAVKSGLAVTITGLVNTVQGVFGIIAATFLVLVLAFYLVIDDMKMKKMLSICVPPRYAPNIVTLLQNIQTRLGGWARGQIVLSFVIGALVYAALSLIGVPYAFALAALAFLLEFIPYAGPTISGIFGVFFALTISPGTAIITALAYYIIQQLENNLIVPKIMEKAAGVDPVLSIVSILVCFEIFGPIGILLGVPIASLIVAFAETYMDGACVTVIES